MNWIIYIGGYIASGFILEEIIFGCIGGTDNKSKRILAALAHLIAWVWICVKFISKI